MNYTNELIKCDRALNLIIDNLTNVCKNEDELVYTATAVYQLCDGVSNSILYNTPDILCSCNLKTNSKYNKTVFKWIEKNISKKIKRVYSYEQTPGNKNRKMHLYPIIEENSCSKQFYDIVDMMTGEKWIATGKVEFVDVDTLKNNK